MKSFNEHIILQTESAREALKKLEYLRDFESRTLFVINESGSLVGSITDGDIRRGLLKDKEISQEIGSFMNTSFKFLTEDTSGLDKLREFRELDINLIPVIDEQKRIIKIIDLKSITTVIPASVLIMAGGKGERLKPLTDNVPKPMLKVGTKPIIEHNIDRLIKFGITQFYISVKYKAEQIIEYLGDGSTKNISITYLQEDEPLGTLGAFGLINDLQNDHLLVMNSDILTNIDFEDFFRYYMENQTQMCIASIPYQVKVPYGVLELKNDHIVSFKEKPTYTYYSNGGLYFLHRSLKELVPHKEFFNATDLMDKLIQQNKKVVHYPILGYWLDIGKHEDYLRAQDDIRHIRF